MHSFYLRDEASSSQDLQTFLAQMSKPLMPYLNGGIFDDCIHLSIGQRCMFQVERIFLPTFCFYEGAFYQLPFSFAEMVDVTIVVELAGGNNVESDIRNMSNISQNELTSRVSEQMNVSYTSNFCHAVVGHSDFAKAATGVGCKHITVWGDVI